MSRRQGVNQRTAALLIAGAVVLGGACSRQIERPRGGEGGKGPHRADAAVSTDPHGELELGPCGHEGCPAEIHLEVPDVPPAHLQLGWPLPVGPARSAVVEGRMGGAGLDCPTSARIWTVGREDKAATVTSCRSALAAPSPALLVSIEAGFEHVRRRVELHVFHGERWRLAWFHEDPQGPTQSRALVLTGNTGEALALFQTTARGPGDFDDVRVAFMTWNKETLAAFNGQAPWVPAAAVIGPFANPKAAHLFRGNRTGCVDDFWVLRGSVFPGGGAGAVLAGPFSDGDSAQRAEKILEGCASPSKVRILPWPVKGDSDARHR